MGQRGSQIKPGTLSRVCRRAFSLILTLMQEHDYGQVNELRRRIHAMFDEVEREARDVGIVAEDMRMARFALTAFLDETIARSDWAGKEEWAQRPLALDDFQTNNAGDEFFDQLEGLRRRPDTKADILEVYYTCLTLGFEGRFALADPRQLRDLIETIGNDLERVRGRVIDLSPHWQPPDPVMKRVRAEIPMWIVTAFCLGLLMILFIVLKYLSLSHADAVAEGLRNVLR